MAATKINSLVNNINKKKKAGNLNQKANQPLAKKLMMI